MKNRERGVTLIALATTIIVLLILAGVSISMITDRGSAIRESKEQAAQAERESIIEKIEADLLTEKTKTGKVPSKTNLKEIIQEKGYNKGELGEDSFITKEGEYEIQYSEILGWEDKVIDLINVGDTVTYEPIGATYIWQAKYCSSLKPDGTENTTDRTLSSQAGGSFRITSWKVLNKNTDGTVDLIASEPTTGKIYIGQAQGYNNAVYLLNEACDTLYGDSNKGIKSRSVKIEDIESKMTEEALKIGNDAAHKYNSENGSYGNKANSAYLNGKYPIIYAQENKSIINGTINNSSSAFEVSEQTKLIERTDNGATNGVLTSTTSIQPYQTFWSKENAFMQTAFKNEGTVNYYDLFMPDGASTAYCLASRSVTTNRDTCGFYIDLIIEGKKYGLCMYASDGYIGNYGTYSIFPIVNLDSKLLTGSNKQGWTIQ